VDHPIFTEQRAHIRQCLGPPPRWGATRTCLERLVAQQRDLNPWAQRLRFSPGLRVRRAWTPWRPGPDPHRTPPWQRRREADGGRTFANPVHSILDWAPGPGAGGGTRSRRGHGARWLHIHGRCVLIGSAPTGPGALCWQG